MPGWVEDPRPWYPGFDVLALPSRSEALGIAAIEAMLARLPVVASRVGGTPEVVVDGDTGILVPPDDQEALARAIRSLLAAPALRGRMGESGREWRFGGSGCRRCCAPTSRTIESCLVPGARPIANQARGPMWAIRARG